MVANKHWQQSIIGFIVLIVLLLGSSALVPQAIAASVTPGITLSSDSETLYFGDTLVIEMEAVGVLDSVDVSVLFRDADLLRETTGTRIAVIEERVVEVKLRRMEFLPRRQGNIVFGPLHGESIAGYVTSNTLSIDVLPATNVQWQPDSDDLQVAVTLSDGSMDGSMDAGKEVSATAYTAYIGQRIIADIQLRHRHPIADEEITLPDFDGFDVLPEYEQRRTIDMSRGAPVTKDVDPSLPNDTLSESEPFVTSNTSANNAATTAESPDDNQGWRLISWRYHLFAQRSGQLEIAPVGWRGEAIRSRTQRAQFSQQTKAIRLNVKPALASIKWWLPTSDVSLSDSWSKDARELTAGDEVIRTITLDARDVLASHLPDVKPLESRAISSTLIGQSRKQTLIGNHIKATATFTFRLVAQSPIPVFLDTVRVQWYDTSQSELREAIIPARRINVGLPDRADLLAEIALGERWQDKLVLQVRSAASQFTYWHVSLALLSLCALALLAQELHSALQQQLSRNIRRESNGLPRL